MCTLLFSEEYLWLQNYIIQRHSYRNANYIKEEKQLQEELLRLFVNDPFSGFKIEK